MLKNNGLVRGSFLELAVGVCLWSAWSALNISAGPPGPGSCGQDPSETGPSEAVTAFFLPACPIWVAVSWSLAHLSLPSTHQICFLKLLMVTDLGLPVQVQFAYVPWIYKLLVPLSSISGTSHLSPEPYFAQPTSSVLVPN